MTFWGIITFSHHLAPGVIGGRGLIEADNRKDILKQVRVRTESYMRHGITEGLGVKRGIMVLLYPTLHVYIATCQFSRCKKCSRCSRVKGGFWQTLTTVKCLVQ